MSDEIDWETARFCLRDALDDEDYSVDSDDDLKQNSLGGTPVLKNSSSSSSGHQNDQVEIESKDSSDNDDGIDWENTQFRLKEDNASNDTINQDQIVEIDLSDAESNADVISGFDREKLRKMLRKLEKMISSLNTAKRQDKRSIAQNIKNMSKNIKNMIHQWVFDGPEILTEDESSSSAHNGNEKNQENCQCAQYEKVRKWVKKIRSIAWFMDSDSSDTESSSSSDEDTDYHPLNGTSKLGKRARRF